MKRPRMRRELIRDEGLVLKPYRCTADKLTIGVGRNLDGKGINRNEAIFLLDSDIEECFDDLRSSLFPGQYERWSEELQRALLNMRFQLGYCGFRSFQKMIEALRSGDTSWAAIEALDSKWARKDTPERAARVVKMMRSSI